MGNTYNLKHYKDKKEGKITPFTIIDELIDREQDGEVESLIIITRDKEGNIILGWSELQKSELIGLLAVGMQTAIDEMREGN